MKGKVWLVGAGPGSAGLLTLRGKQALDRAEVVVYDALVGDEVLSLIPDTARPVFAGKRAGSHHLEQSEINRILLEEAQKGYRVVRLKGGDPFVFGRGGEELELLVEHGIPFEVVPGVTSALAIPACLGIPVTHRDYAASIHILTGHRRADRSLGLDFPALAKTGGTLIFLMGVTALPEICRGLLGAGMDPDTPAAVLEKGTTAAQRMISGTLAILEAAADSESVRAPAIIVVGPVCALAERFAWMERRPLGGVRALVTRPKELTSGLAELLRERGAEVIELPAIAIRPNREALSESLRILKEGGCDYLVFTSPSGVRVFFDALREHSDIRILGGVKTAALGQGTKLAMHRYGLRADFVPSVYDAGTLGRELAAVCAPGERVLIPRAAVGSQELIDALLARGLHVTDLPAYETVYESPHVVDERGLIERGEIDFAVFTSASTVRGFAAVMDGADLSGVRAVCIGRQTEAEARKRGMRTWISDRATLESLADCVERAAREVREEEEDTP